MVRGPASGNPEVVQTAQTLRIFASKLIPKASSHPIEALAVHSSVLDEVASAQSTEVGR
jgi:hypothetical protein